MSVDPLFNYGVFTLGCILRFNQEDYFDLRPIVGQAKTFVSSVEPRDAHNAEFTSATFCIARINASHVECHLHNCNNIQILVYVYDVRQLNKAMSIASKFSLLSPTHLLILLVKLICLQLARNVSRWITHRMIALLDSERDPLTNGDFER